MLFIGSSRQCQNWADNVKIETYNKISEQFSQRI